MDTSRIGPNSSGTKQDCVTTRQHTEMLRTLCEARNAKYSATKELPVEVLILLFKFVSTAALDPLVGVRWVQITHVCRYWRTIALKETELWCNIADSFPRPWVEEMLRRASNARLSLSFDSDPENRPINGLLRDQVIRFPERLRGLHIKAEYHYEIVLHLAKPAPYLEELTMEEWTPLPSHFLAGTAPRLRSFTSRNCRISFNAPWLSQIREVNLHGVWYPVDTPNDVRTLVEFLGNLSHLESLTMSVPWLPANGPLPQKSARLPIKTMNLGLVGPCPGYQEFLEFLVPENLQQYRVSISSVTSLNLQIVLASVEFFVQHTKLPLDTIVWKLNDPTNPRLALSSSTESGSTAHTLEVGCPLLEQRLIVSMNDPFDTPIGIQKSGFVAHPNTRLARKGGRHANFSFNPRSRPSFFFWADLLSFVSSKCYIS